MVEKIKRGQTSYKHKIENAQSTKLLKKMKHKDSKYEKLETHKLELRASIIYY